MTKTQQAERKPGTPGRFSRWLQVKMGARASRKIRDGKGQMMGMDVLVLTTVGRRSGEPRATPLAWFADGESWLVVASGGGSQHPDWHANLTAHPDQVTVEFAGQAAVPVTAERLGQAERAAAWKRIAEAQPRIAKYQEKSEREYPVLRLTRR
ncbi:nitroreductase family deazaflavin-dependent oxidoreductase [Kribbella italica]|uniref:Deazaflavin-dependent oxidoreductase (Nitroreductase family) n=1 Tax=Kribbella italica TaxID=1540520 RepID=A0A7W9MSN6_9ACTN|nr:nitroreductase family deazaflavin-dependent oxidoreductase [Kribbella italica]MBB5834901.1 deazaflavin-dependent oxidoreductase (nitroreductase family) [Kribbella italica]